MVGSLQVSSALSTKKAASSISSSRCWAISWIKISNISISHHHSSSPSKICTGLIPTLPQQILLISNSNSRSSCRKVYRPQVITILLGHLRNWARKTAESPHSIIIHLQSSISSKMTLSSLRSKTTSDWRVRLSSFEEIEWSLMSHNIMMRSSWQGMLRPTLAQWCRIILSNSISHHNL